MSRDIKGQMFEKDGLREWIMYEHCKGNVAYSTGRQNDCEDLKTWQKERMPEGSYPALGLWSNASPGTCQKLQDWMNILGSFVWVLALTEKFVVRLTTLSAWLMATPLSTCGTGNSIVPQVAYQILNAVKTSTTTEFAMMEVNCGAPPGKLVIVLSLQYT